MWVLMSTIVDDEAQCVDCVRVMYKLGKDTDYIVSNTMGWRACDI